MDQKLQHKTHFFFISFFFCNFERKKTETFWLINGHFTAIFVHFFAIYMKIFHKTEVQTVILRYFEFLKLNWIKSYYIILSKKNHARKCIILGLICRSEFRHLRRKPAVIFLKWLFFQNSFVISWDTQSGKMMVKKNWTF